MSTTVSSGVWQCGPRDMASAMVLLAIADNADDYGFGFPSHDTIAQKARCDRRTVIRRLEDLEAEGWIRVLRKAVNGKGNLYWIDIGKIGVTVSPESRRSPMITHLLKASGVSESPIFWPEKSGDSKKISGDNPQPTQVTPVQSQVTPVQGQVTQLSHTNRKTTVSEPSVLEPSADVEQNPLPPLQGVSGMSGLGSLAKSLRQELSEAPDVEAAAELLQPAEQLAVQFTRLRSSLAQDLSRVPQGIAGQRFVEIVPGENDFDACFLDWWLLSVELQAARPRGPGVPTAMPAMVTIITGSATPAITRKGFDKYGPRMQHRARECFQLSPMTAVRFAIADTNVNQQPAA